MNRNSTGSRLPLLVAFLLGSLTRLAMTAEFRPEVLSRMDAEISTAIQSNKCPGGVLWLEHRGTIYHKAYGNRSVMPQLEAMTEDTIFDAASLTKVVATTPAIMLLVERGLVDLDTPAKEYLPEFTGAGKETITVRQLMTHTTGLRPDISTKGTWTGIDGALSEIAKEKLQTPPGTAIRYSDINFIVLGLIVQRVSNIPLQDFVKREVFTPLGMKDTEYLPPASKNPRIAPTEVVEGRPYRGVVHDPTSRKMGGVAGHAGLFTTAADLARYARMLLGGGELDGVRVFKPETIKRMTAVQTPPTIDERRGLGWDIDSSYSGPRGKLFPLGSYGHTGWTGTSIWIDPFSSSFVIFMSNRNHPTEDGNVIGLRARLGTLAAEAITDYDFAHVEGALPPRLNRAREKTTGVLNGIDVLARKNFAPLKGLKLALITNHTGQDRQRNATIDLLKNAPGVELKFLFSPEHGIRGMLDEKVSDSVDEKTGLKVISLYGEKRKPTPEQMREIDALVFDIQDIGCRFYTYPSTMGLAIEAAAENGKKIFVLDRVNPIGGVSVEGPVLDAKPSFVGFYEVPLRHGMTLGELAMMYNAKLLADTKRAADLVVIPVEGWHREQTFDKTGLPWSNPSPNMRNLKQAILYPGIGLLESALSVGRGTDTPFELIGAPYVDDLKLAAEMNAAGLEGVSFVPIRFTPTASVHQGKLCKGVYIMLNDPGRCEVVSVGIQLAITLHRLYPNDFPLDKIKHLLLHPATLDALKNNKSLSDIKALWAPGLETFQKTRAKYLLY